MLYSYAGFPERGWKLIRHKRSKGKRGLPLVQNDQESGDTPGAPRRADSGALSKTSIIDEQEGRGLVTTDTNVALGVDIDGDEDQQRKRVLKNNAMSGLSIILTIISILLAFTYVSNSLMQRRQTLMSEWAVVSH